MRKTSATLVLIAGLAAWISASLAQSTGPNVTSSDGSCSTPRQYVELINDGKYNAVGSLFAGDALYMGPDGRTRHGAKEIGAFYSRFLPKLKPQLRASKFFEQGNECMMELENKSSQSGEFSPVAVDHFVIDSAGKISSFTVYLRPGSESTRLLRRALSTR